MTRASERALAAYFHGKLIVITGGSSGIGLATAERLAAIGARLVLVADRRDKLDAAVAAVARIAPAVDGVACDVGVPASVAAAFAALEQRHGVPDILMNNAGFAVYRTFEQSAAEEIERLFEVNFAGHLRCTRAVLPGMIARRGGQILNIASIAGLITATPNAVYAASKWGMVGWSRALRIELARFNIGVSLVCPGRVETPFFDHETFRARPHRRESDLTTIPMARVVDAILHAAARNRELVVVPRYFGWIARFAAAVPLALAVQHRLLARRVEDLYRQ